MTTEHISIRVQDIDNYYEYSDDSMEATTYAQEKAVEEIKSTAQYHLWIDDGGFCKGDANDYEIEDDMKRTGSKNQDELFEKLNDLFIKHYKSFCEKNAD